MAGLTISQVYANYNGYTPNFNGSDTGWYDFVNGRSDNLSPQNWFKMLTYENSQKYHTAYVFKCPLVMQANSKAISVRLTTNFFAMKNPYNPQNVKLTCYLYTTNPIDARDAFHKQTPPSGYIASTTATLHWDAFGTTGGASAPGPTNTRNIRQSFTINGIDLRSNTTLYFWIKIEEIDQYTSQQWRFANVYIANQNAPITVATSEAGVTFEKIPTSVTLSPVNVTSGGSVSVTIANARPTETVKFRCGNTLLATQTISNGYASVTCPKTWFDDAGVTTSKTISITASVEDTALSASMTLTAGSDMQPAVGAPTTTLVQSSSAVGFPTTYIANLSRAKVSAGATFPTDAGFSSAVLSAPGMENITMEYNALSQKYEATTPPVTGDTVFTVTVTDVRGMIGTNTVALTGVMEYVPPSVLIDEAYTYRCDQNGQKQDGGAYVRVRAVETHYTALEGNTLQVFRFYVEEEPTQGDDLVSGVQSSACPFVNRDSTGTVVVEIQDQLSGIIQKRLRLPSRQRNFVMKRSSAGTYAALGMAPTRSSGLTSLELPPGGEFMIGGYSATALTHLPSAAQDGTQFSKDFLQIDDDVLYVDENAEAFFEMSSSSGWSNYPAARSTGWSGLRKVVWIDGTHILVKVLEFSPTPGDQWINFYDGSTWNGWRHIASTL